MVTDATDVLTRLKSDIERLPRLLILFGGGHECVPESLIRSKVLAVIQHYIDQTRGPV